MPDKHDIVIKESPRLKGEDLKRVVLMTSMGAQYVIPDVTPEQLAEFIMQIDWARQNQVGDANLVLRNISGAALTIPFRILAEVGVVSGSDDLRWKRVWRG